MSDLNILDRLAAWAKRDGADVARVAREHETAETILAACEYELGQMRREIAMPAGSEGRRQPSSGLEFRIDQRQRAVRRSA